MHKNNNQMSTEKLLMSDFKAKDNKCFKTDKMQPSEMLGSVHSDKMKNLGGINETQGHSQKAPTKVTLSNQVETGENVEIPPSSRSLAASEEGLIKKKNKPSKDIL